MIHVLSAAMSILPMPGSSKDVTRKRKKYCAKVWLPCRVMRLLHHALGLLLTRKGVNGAAQKEFVEAARLDPSNARYAYVHAIALHSAGKRVEALTVLRKANNRHPNDLDILSALISINREAGDRHAALRYAKQAAALLPDDPNLSKLVVELSF